MTDTIKLINIIDSINNTKTKGNALGFVFKNYLISVHHFKPILYTLINSIDKIILEPAKKILWNELQIFNCPKQSYIENIKNIKTYRTRFLEKGTNVEMTINKRKETFACCGYDTIYHTHIQKSIYLKVLLSENTNDINKFIGLSGSPVFESEHLIGIFTKIEKSDKLYGYILPVIYLIRSLEKKDNENLYYLNLESHNNIKIGKYDLQNNESVIQIYYQPINYKIPFEIYCTMEGDIDKDIITKNLKTHAIKKYDYEKYDNFDISINLIRRDNTLKLNTGLLMYLVSNGKDSELKTLITEYQDNNKSLNDIWLKYANSVI
jgi:hypothetical protein